MWSDQDLMQIHKAPADAGVFPHFYTTVQEDPEASKKEGRPVFREVEMIALEIPANPKTRPVYRVKDEHRAKYADAYKRFRAGLEARPDGTPLEEWPYLTKLRVAELKALQVYTVEQIAGLSDTQLQKVGSDGLEIQKRAKQFLQPEGATVKELRAENRGLAEEIAQLKGIVAQLQNAQKG